MDSNKLPMLRWSTAALVLCGYWALSAVPQIGPIVLLPPILALACARPAEYLHARYSSYGVVTRGVTIAYLCFLPLTVISLQVLNAVTVLVCYIQLYTLLHQKEARNYYHLHLMSLFLLLAACVQSPDPIIGIIMVCFLISAVWASLALRMAAEQAGADALTEPEIVGLDNMDHPELHGKTIQGRASMPIAATGLSVIMVTMTVLFFVLTPRIEAGIFGRSQEVIERTGLSEEVELGSNMTIELDNTPVLMARFPDEPNGQVPTSDWLYWRVTTFGKYAGNGWREQRGELIDPGIAHRRSIISDPTSYTQTRGGDAEVSRTPRAGRRLVRQLIYLDQPPSTGIPAMSLVQSVRISESSRGKRLRWGHDGDLTVVLDKAGSVNRLNYEAWSEPDRPTAEQLRAAPDFTLPAGDGSAAAFLEYSLSPESVALANQVTAEATNAYDKAVAIEEYLSGPNYLYSLRIPDMGAGPMVDTFINRTKLGHCELFATAMALMLRSQGIPTRVVSGYRGGEWQSSDETYTVRASMAHLWVEVWFPEHGWVIFDPSPQSDNFQSTQMERLALFLSRVGLKAKMFWFQEIVGFDRESHLQRLREMSLGVVRSFTGEEEEEVAGVVAGGSTSSRQTGMSNLFLLMVSVGLSIWLLIRFRNRAAPSEFELTPDQIKVIELYLTLRRLLRKHGVDCRGKTAEDIEATLASPVWGAPEGAMKLLACYNTVRFGGAPLPPEVLAELKRGLRTLKPLDNQTAKS